MAKKLYLILCDELGEEYEVEYIDHILELRGRRSA